MLKCRVAEIGNYCDTKFSVFVIYLCSVRKKLFDIFFFLSHVSGIYLDTTPGMERLPIERLHTHCIIVRLFSLDQPYWRHLSCFCAQF